MWLREMSDKIHDIRKVGILSELLHLLLRAYKERTEAWAGSGDNSQLLTAINNLDGKVSEFMATQEERLRGVKTKLDAIQSGVDKIQQQLADLKANNPDLEDEISAIEATASAIDTDVNPVATEPPAGGGDTGGAPV
jgi:septal ring factor EnvC (AmiA/AmiB activator)